MDKGVGYSANDSVDNRGGSGYNTRYGEDLKSTPIYLMPTTNREWQTFTRSFANKTNDIKRGDTKVVTVFTADNRYLILADGYMSGVIYDKVDLIDVNEMEKFIDDYRPSKFLAAQMLEMGIDKETTLTASVHLRSQGQVITLMNWMRSLKVIPSSSEIEEKVIEILKNGQQT